MNTHKLIITGNQLELSEPMKQYVHDKTDKLFRHDPRIIRIRVEVGMELNKHQERLFTARGTVEVDGPDLFASERSTNAYAAIDLVVHKLGRQLRRRHRLRLFKRVRPHPIDLPASLPKVRLRPLKRETGSGFDAA